MASLGARLCKGPGEDQTRLWGRDPRVLKRVAGPPMPILRVRRGLASLRPSEALAGPNLPAGRDPRVLRKQCQPHDKEPNLLLSVCVTSL